MIKKITKKEPAWFDKHNIFYFVFILLFSVFFVFYLMHGSFFGRFVNLTHILGNVFIGDIFRAFQSMPRTYSTIIFSVLQEFFQFRVTPFTVLFFNKILSVFLLLVIFFLSKIIFKQTWISLVVYMTFISSKWIQFNMHSIEYSIGAMFFAYSSMLFLLLFIKEKDLSLFILSNISLILAAYYRYELAFLFAMAYLAYFSVFLKHTGKRRKIIALTMIILILISMALVKLFTVQEFDFLLFRNNELGENRLFSFIGKSFYIFKYNVIANKDLSLSSGYVSLFTYFGVAFSAILFLFLIFRLITNSKKSNKFNVNNLIFIFVFYNLIYIVFELFFTMEGFRESWKYYAQHIFCEIIIVYYMILFLIERIFNKYSYTIINSVKFSAVFLFFLIAFFTSPGLSLDRLSVWNPTVDELNILTENILINESCEIIKISVGQPVLDYYYSLQKNSVYFGIPPEFYENLERYDKKGKCFYFYDEKYYTERDYNSENLFKADIEKMDNIFKECIKSIDFESPLENRPFSLIRYIC
ncbi:oligosaccharide repeat unit polymerase [Candidatus Woesearchaeota archaeon]|nr:oligosaccharide repeat unit polymerase [Candidatus Woesearchaeota archaeon]